MPTSLIATMCIVGAIVAVAGAICAVLAAADPEGRGEDYTLGSFVTSVCGMLVFAGFGIWTLTRLLA